jgi:hypothetical protein
MDDGGWIPDKGNEGIYFLLHSVQTGFGAHSASCLVGTGNFFPRVKLTTHPQLVPTLRMR